jgi:hypothetical protein
MNLRGKPIKTPPMKRKGTSNHYKNWEDVSHGDVMM